MSVPWFFVGMAFGLATGVLSDLGPADVDWWVLLVAYFFFCGGIVGAVREHN